MGPLEILFGWQALLLAVIVSIITQMIKTTIDLIYTRDARKANKWLTRLALPLVPIFVGAFFGMFVPLRPEVLIDYVVEHVEDNWQRYLVYGTWGAACGQFADYLFSKLKDFLNHPKYQAQEQALEVLESFRPPPPSKMPTIAEESSIPEKM